MKVLKDAEFKEQDVMRWHSGSLHKEEHWTLLEDSRSLERKVEEVYRKITLSMSEDLRHAPISINRWTTRRNRQVYNQ